MINLDVDIPEKLLPFAWLNGSWKGFGVSYDIDSNPTDIIIEMDFSSLANNNDSFENEPFLKQTINVYNVDLEKSSSVDKEMKGLVGYKNLHINKLLYTQDSYWSLGKEIKPTQPKTRAFELKMLSVSSTGHAGSWYGILDGPTIQVVTDACLCAENAPQYGGQKQLYGLVESDLMFLVEVPDKEKQLRPILSARMSKANNS